MILGKSIEKIDSSVLVEYILERGGSMSHLKLQKLLFYIEAYHLAYFDTSLITDEFEAWLHGPVSRKIYDLVKGYSILYREVEYLAEPGKDSPSIVVSSLLTKEQQDLVNDIIDEFGKLTPHQLENLTHNELPWIEARKGYGPADRCSVIISKDTMKKYYANQIYGKA